jgi:Na+-driven multidrug efflux pump
MFQGTGKGTYSLIMTLIRAIVLTTPITYIMAITLNLQLTGLWWGIVIGNSLGASIAFIWGRYYVRHLSSRGASPVITRSEATW